MKRADYPLPSLYSRFVIAEKVGKRRVAGYDSNLLDNEPVFMHTFDDEVEAEWYIAYFNRVKRK